MTETKFTLGPWYATANGGDDPDERKLLVGKDDAYGDFTTVSDCRSKWLEDEVGGDEEANAHLIAAAPELYEVLAAFIGWEQYIRDDLHEWCSHDLTGESKEALDRFEAELTAARLALAKARGES